MTHRPNGTAAIKKSILWFAMIVSGMAVAAGLLLIVATAWFVWQLHPWVAAGQAFELGRWRFGDCEFQVWQRKNPQVFEPFADGLFVQHRRGRTSLVIIGSRSGVVEVHVQRLQSSIRKLAMFISRQSCPS